MIECTLHRSLISILLPQSAKAGPFFRSGLWRGSYTQGGHQFPQQMYLQIRDGTLEGHGDDGIGPFLVMGVYDEQNGTASWLKKYIGKHLVFYVGQRNGPTLIGTWRIESYYVISSDVFEFTPPDAAEAVPGV
jgi:hypothetical protein